MPTTINNPGTNPDTSSTNVLLVGVILLVAVLLLFWFFGAPTMRRNGNGTEQPTIIENTMQPPAEDTDTDINVPIPDQIDVNVQQDEN